MEKRNLTPPEEIKQRPEHHTVWIDETERIASFHAVEGYTAHRFSTHEFFMDYLYSLQERRFRFQ